MNLIKFRVNSEKSLELILYITSFFPGATHYYVGKIMYYAEKYHLNKYGTPIIGDSYRKMEYGPAPINALYIIKQNPRIFNKVMIRKILSSLDIKQDGKKLHITPKRPANLYEFCGTELDCVDQAIVFCKNKSFGELKDISHTEEAWGKTNKNKLIDCTLMIDKNNPNRKHIISDLQERTAFLGC